MFFDAPAGRGPIPRLKAMDPLGVHGGGRSGISGSTGSSTRSSRSTSRPTWRHPVASLRRRGGVSLRKQVEGVIRREGGGLRQHARCQCCASGRDWNHPSFGHDSMVWCRADAAGDDSCCGAHLSLECLDVGFGRCRQPGSSRVLQCAAHVAVRYGAQLPFLQSPAAAGEASELGGTGADAPAETLAVWAEAQRPVQRDSQQLQLRPPYHPLTRHVDVAVCGVSGVLREDEELGLLARDLHLVAAGPSHERGSRKLRPLPRHGDGVA